MDHGDRQNGAIIDGATSDTFCLAASAELVATVPPDIALGVSSRDLVEKDPSDRIRFIPASGNVIDHGK